ncbi:aminomethyl-transferring glycine dehydrogenase subunit GcvPA [Candidatus Peregrinibacteria bacterium]|nr:aminomethyl-transferring glycine dehydrogenase subunit GcvPA [Candidatus Peregrinibacteria bacterium]
MPYIPHTKRDTEEMLKAIGINQIEDLFEAVPSDLLEMNEFNLPAGFSEQETRQHVSGIAAKNWTAEASFLGGGFYHHYIPEHVTNLGTRSEFFTAYTPYQPEISQGILQAIFEYQTMIVRLTGLDATNASMYDGSSATGETCLMAANITDRKKILVARSVHPQYREVMRTYCNGKGLIMEEVPFDMSSGQVDAAALGSSLTEEIAGIFVQSPNFFGVVENMKELSDMAHEKGAVSVQIITEALSLGILTPPGKNNVDIAVGEGQSFGIPVSGGGPSFGFLACVEKYIRKLPGRIVGETVDEDGKKAYVLTLQAREQHIRREKASSNICTNQTLFAIRALIYLATLGKKLRDLALLNHSHSLAFQKMLSEKGLRRVFSKPFFNEFVVDGCDTLLLQKLKEQRIAGGLPLKRFYPELKNSLLVCVTEMITKDDMEKYLREFLFIKEAPLRSA